MEKKSLLILLCILIIPLVSAGSLEVTHSDTAATIIAELNNPATYKFEVTNNFGPDSFEIYSLQGVSMTPVGFFELRMGNHEFDVSAMPSAEVRKDTNGLYVFDYQIKGQEAGISAGKLSMRIVGLRDVLEINGENLLPSDEVIKVRVRNVNNIYLENITVQMKSVFFETQKVLSFEPFEEVEILIDADKDKLKTIMAGTYIFSVSLEYKGEKAKTEGVIVYLEKEGTSINKVVSGLIVRKTSVTKINEGNIPVSARIDLSKDVLSRLFTSYNIEPTQSERSGLVVRYVWEKNLAPSESFEVVSVTNYTFPLVLIILAVAVILLVKATGREDLVLKKRISFVKSKGGEFALKVTIHAKARKDIDNLSVIDRIPNSVKLYGSIGRKPDRVDEAMGRLVWSIGKLNAGEGRIFSYIIYSKVRVIGRFELPPAKSVFDVDGQRKFSSSNRTYFVSDTNEDSN